MEKIGINNASHSLHIVFPEIQTLSVNHLLLLKRGTKRCMANNRSLFQLQTTFFVGLGIISLLLLLNVLRKYIVRHKKESVLPATPLNLRVIEDYRKSGRGAELDMNQINEFFHEALVKRNLQVVGFFANRQEDKADPIKVKVDQTEVKKWLDEEVRKKNKTRVIFFLEKLKSDVELTKKWSCEFVEKMHEWLCAEVTAENFDTVKEFFVEKLGIKPNSMELNKKLKEAIEERDQTSVDVLINDLHATPDPDQMHEWFKEAVAKSDCGIVTFLQKKVKFKPKLAQLEKFLSMDSKELGVTMSNILKEWRTEISNELEAHHSSSMRSWLSLRISKLSRYA